MLQKPYVLHVMKLRRLAKGIVRRISGAGRTEDLRISKERRLWMDRT